MKWQNIRKIIFKKEKCVICGGDANVLYGRKTSYGYFDPNWFCRDHFCKFLEISGDGITGVFRSEPIE